MRMSHWVGDDCPGGHYDRRWTRETVRDATEAAHPDADAATDTQDHPPSPARPIGDPP